MIANGGSLKMMLVQAFVQVNKVNDMMLDCIIWFRI